MSKYEMKIFYAAYEADNGTKISFQVDNREYIVTAKQLVDWLKKVYRRVPTR
jgi:hypothetical protein